MRKLDISLDTSKLFGWQAASPMAKTMAGGVKPVDTLTDEVKPPKAMQMTMAGIAKPVEE